MKPRLVLWTLLLLAVVVGIGIFAVRGLKPRSTAPVAAARTVPPVPSAPAASPARQLPAGWQGFASLKPAAQLNRVTAAMENHNLPPDVLAFFEKEIFHRKYWDVTRNNMANALVWQETPNPRLHELFTKMLEDQTESPVWRDYCLQFLSECLKSTAEPDAVKAVLARYSKGKDGLAGTAIVNLAYQEGEGRLRNDEAFSKQIEAQLADPDVATPTKMSILGVIGKRQDTRLLPLVRTYAKDPNDGIRRCAIAALGLIGTQDDLPLIQPGLTDRNRAVQMAAKAAEERIRSRSSSSGKSEG